MSAPGQHWWASTGSKKWDQSKLQALGLGLGSGSWVRWMGGCRVAGPTRWEELSFCTRGMTTAWRRSPILSRSPRAPVGDKGAGALGSIPQRRHGGHVALILSHDTSGQERLSFSAFCSGGESLRDFGVGGLGSAAGSRSPGVVSSSSFSGLGLADLANCPGPRSWCLPRKTQVECECETGSSGWGARDDTEPTCWRKGFSGTGGGLEKPLQLPAPPGQSEGGR